MRIIAEAGAEARRSAQALIRGWSERRRQRRALARLVENSDHLLRDIGLTREQARREATKPFWL